MLLNIGLWQIFSFVVICQLHSIELRWPFHSLSKALSLHELSSQLLLVPCSLSTSSLFLAAPSSRRAFCPLLFSSLDVAQVLLHSWNGAGTAWRRRVPRARPCARHHRSGDVAQRSRARARRQHGAWGGVARRKTVCIARCGC